VTVPLIVLTNGRRDCISRTIPSAAERLTGISHMSIIDDSGDPGYGRWLEEEFIGGPLNGHVLHLADGGGYWKAMCAVWAHARHLLDFLRADAVFFLEDDFTFNADVPVAPMRRVLNASPYLTQMALLRQPWFGNEVAAGGLIEALEQQGQVFTERSCGVYRWIEHRACFTGNPSLIPARTFAHDWPSGAWSESRFGRALFADPAARGAYWGRRGDAPLVEHIGHERVGSDY
jgi:hypothetical protein